jgi:hypothetical protein
MVYARMLGMDLTRDSECVWIADEIARSELPLGWAEVVGERGGVRFLDTTTGVLTDEHPMGGYYKSLFHRNKPEAATRKSGEAPASAALLAAGPAQADGDDESGSSSLGSDDSDYDEKRASRSGRQKQRRRRERGRRGSGGREYSSDDDDEDGAEAQQQGRFPAGDGRKPVVRKSTQALVMERAEKLSQKKLTTSDRIALKQVLLSRQTPLQTRHTARHTMPGFQLSHPWRTGRDGGAGCPAAHRRRHSGRQLSGGASAAAAAEVGGGRRQAEARVQPWGDR